MRRIPVIRYIAFSLAVAMFFMSSCSLRSSSQEAGQALETPLQPLTETFSGYSTREVDIESLSAVIEEHSLVSDDADIELIAPDTLPAGETLICSAALIGFEPGLEGVLTWQLYDLTLLTEQVVTGTELPGISYEFEYTREMQGTALIRVIFQFVKEDGVEYDLISEKTIILENYSRQHWMEPEVERVAELVTSSYKGDRTLKWAQENDYADFDKEVFVNLVKEYESETNYLIWVNRTYQRANIFTGSAGNWELMETFIVATGGPSSATRRGVSKIPSRTKEGWHFGHFIVEPVVRFFPGSRYAFHSRPLHPRTREVTDDRIGFPVSAGCVRMYCDDIWFIYNNIPDGTTVVIH